MKVVVGLLLMMLVVGCSTDFDAPESDPKDGVITGNGGGLFKAKRLKEVPHKKELYEFLDKLSEFEPKLVSWIKLGIDGNDIEFFQRMRIEQEVDQPVEYEKCVLENDAQKLEKRAGYDNGRIQLCRAFFLRSPSFTKKTSLNFRISTLMHEIFHYIYDLRNVQMSEVAEEQEIGFLEEYVNDMLIAAELDDEEEFKFLARRMRKSLETHVPGLEVGLIADLSSGTVLEAMDLEKMVSAMPKEIRDEFKSNLNDHFSQVGLTKTPIFLRMEKWLPKQDQNGDLLVDFYENAPEIIKFESANTSFLVRAFGTIGDDTIYMAIEGVKEPVAGEVYTPVVLPDSDTSRTSQWNFPAGLTFELTKS
jgi:hypothetical protein